MTMTPGLIIFDSKRLRDWIMIKQEVGMILLYNVIVL